MHYLLVKSRNTNKNPIISGLNPRKTPFVSCCVAKVKDKHFDTTNRDDKHCLVRGFVHIFVDRNTEMGHLRRRRRSDVDRLFRLQNYHMEHRKTHKNYLYLITTITRSTFTHTQKLLQIYSESSTLPCA